MAVVEVVPYPAFIVAGSSGFANYGNKKAADKAANGYGAQVEGGSKAPH